MKKSLFLLITIFLLFFTSEIQISDAQAVLPPGFKEEVLITVSPNTPAPGENVRIKIESFSRDLNSSTITWSLNGIVQKQGLGEFIYDVVAPAAGQTSTIDITVFTSGGQDLKEQIILAPAAVDLIFEADTYTPPLYKGRSLFSPQSVVKIVAISELVENGSKLNKSNIAYTWEKDGVVLQDLSGVGKDSISFTGKIIPRPFSVTVTAKSTDTGVSAKKTIQINIVKPQVVVYKDSALYGNIFEKALLGAETFEEEEFGIIAIPYFFSANSKDDPSLKYSWKENDKLINVPTMESRVLFTNEKLEKSGLSDIFVSVSHSDYILQSTKYNFIFNIVGSNPLNLSRENETTIF